MSVYPLAGVEVVDLTTGVAGALCAKLVADAGAHVKRVELPSAHPAPMPYPDGDWCAFLNQGKKFVAHDPSRPSDRDELERLLGNSQLYLTSLAGREGEPLGLDCASVRLRHPDRLTACITPFGTDGPYAQYRTDDLVLSALCGLAHATPGFPDRQLSEDEPPVQSLAPLAEVGAGITAAVAVFGALHARLRGAHSPSHVEVAELEAAVWMMVSEWGLASYGGIAPGRRRESRTLEPNLYVRCRDDYLVIVGTSDKHWQEIVEVMGTPEWTLDPRFADVEGRAANPAALHDHLREWARDKSGREFMEAAQARGVPCNSYFELKETVASEHVRETEALQDIAGRLFPGDPIQVNGVRRHPRSAARPRTAVSRNGVPDSSGLPLQGVRVLDLTQMVAGPFAGQILAALGAEVTIVESRAHLPSRHFGPFAGEPTYDASANFNHANRGKRSVELDLTTERGQELLRELVETSDVVLENFSRRAAEKLGLTYDELREQRADVILASISAFGRTGPWGGYASHHGGVTALTGLASVIRDLHREPRLVGAIMPDVLTGTYMALAILQALAARDQTGEGCRLDVSMLDVLFTCMGGLIPSAAEGTTFGPHPGRFLVTAEPGGFVALSTEDADSHPELAAAVSRQSRQEAMASLQAAGLRAGAVLDMLEVIADPHLRARGFILEQAHSVAGRRPLPAVPWLYDGRRPTLAPAPLLGDSTERILLERTELDGQQVEVLRLEGVLR